MAGAHRSTPLVQSLPYCKALYSLPLAIINQDENHGSLTSARSPSLGLHGHAGTGVPARKDKDDE